MKDKQGDLNYLIGYLIEYLKEIEVWEKKGDDIYSKTGKKNKDLCMILAEDVYEDIELVKQTP